MLFWDIQKGSMRIIKRFLEFVIVFAIIALAITRKGTLDENLKDVDKMLQSIDVPLEEFTVTKVVDGDTLWLKNDSYTDSIKVRLIGIDTPESVASEDSGKINTKEGVISSDRTKEIVTKAGNTVYLEFDAQTEDKYGRVLAYVYVKEDNDYIMIEDILLKEGLARVMTIQPNNKYEDHFVEIGRKAEEEKAGFWNTEFYK